MVNKQTNATAVFEEKKSLNLDPWTGIPPPPSESLTNATCSHSYYFSHTRNKHINHSNINKAKAFTEDGPMGSQSCCTSLTQCFNICKDSSKEKLLNKVPLTMQTTVKGYVFPQEC